MKKLYTGKSNINGTGLFTAEAIKNGEFISFVKGTKKKFCSTDAVTATNIPTWYGVTKTIWIDPEKSVFQFFNHSCDPNTAIIGTKKVIARKNIAAGEEITFDYSFTDGDVNWTLENECSCGTKLCRKKIQSIQRLSPKTVRGHYPFIPRYFLNLYKKTHPGVRLE